MIEYIILALFGLWALIPIAEMIKDIGRVEKEIYGIERFLSLPSHFTFWQKKKRKRRKESEI